MEGRLVSHKSPAEIHNFWRNVIFIALIQLMVCGSPINWVSPHTQFRTTVSDDVSRHRTLDELTGGAVLMSYVPIKGETMRK